MSETLPAKLVNLGEPIFLSREDRKFILSVLQTFYDEFPTAQTDAKCKRIAKVFGGVIDTNDAL